MGDKGDPQPPRRVVARKVAAPAVPAADRVVSETPEQTALRALAAKHGVPSVDLARLSIAIADLIVPREIATAHQVLPLLVKDESLFLAMVNPAQPRVIDELEFVTGKKVFPYVASPEAMAVALRGAYDAHADGALRYAGAHAGPNPGLNVKSLSETENAGSDVPIGLRKAPLPAGAFGALAKVGDETFDDSAVVRHPDPASGKVVLIVDDEDTIRSLLRTLLESAGYQVLEASRGLAALQMVKSRVPDLIVLDAMLPEVHGFDIARRIRGSAKYGAIPIVMISAVYRGWRIAEDLKVSYGIQAFIEKPFKLAEVASVVARLLAGNEAASGPHSERATAASASAEKALADGMAAYAAGAVADAVALLSRGVATDPLSFRLRYQLGLVLGATGDVFDSITHLESAIELRSDHFGALRNLAILYEKAGFKHRAIEVWERAVPHAPDAELRERIKQQIIGLLG